MKFIELLERVFDNPELEFKFKGDDTWSIIEYLKGNRNDAGINFLNNHGETWWPTDEQRKSDNWILTGKSLKEKTKSLFVVYEVQVSEGNLRIENTILNGFTGSYQISNANDLSDIQNKVLKKLEKQLRRKTQIVIIDWKWLGS